MMLMQKTQKKVHDKFSTFMKKNNSLKILLFLLIITSLSCQEKKEVRENLINNNNIIMKVLEKQLRQGANQYINLDDGGNVEIPKKKFEVEEFTAIVSVVKNVLNSNAYKKPDNEQFAKKVKEIFGRVIAFDSEKKYLYINYFDKCDKIFNNNPNDGVDFYGSYIVKDDNFISDFYYLPQIIEYIKEFPELANMESNLPKEYSEDGKNYSIETWKSLENRKEKEYNLSVSRKTNINILINRNKYLFNDNKASLVWLKFNDVYFLESLVKTFGYVQDKDLLKWVLDKNLVKDGDIDEFEKVLWTKSCDNKIIFHSEVFDLMNLESENNKKKYIASLENYISDFNNAGLSFSEQAKIKALVCYYGTKLSGSIEPSDIYQFFPIVSGKEYEEEFIKNNYYNFSDFKKIYEETKTGGVSYPGMLD